MLVKRIFLSLAIAMIASVAIIAQSDVSDLVGSRANGDQALRDRGYTYVNGTNNDGRTYANWWNRNSRACINVVTRNGRYESINGVAAGECNQNGGWNGGGYNDDYGNWNGNGSMSVPPSWARGRFYSQDGIELRIRGNGQVFVVNGGQTYYGRFYNNRIYLNGDASTIAKTRNGFSTFNLNTRQTTYYSSDSNGGSGGWNGGNNGGGGWNDDYGNWNGNGSMSAPPNWARGRFYSQDGIELRIRNNGQVFVVNGGQTFYGRFYNNRIYLNGDASTIAKTRNGFSTFNLNTRQTTYYSSDRNGGSGGWNDGNNGGGGWNDDYGNWSGNGALSEPPSWARGRFSSPDGIELRIRSNGEVFVVNGGQTFYGRFYNNRIYLNGDASTITRTNNGFSTYNLNLRQTTYYTKR